MKRAQVLLLAVAIAGCKGDALTLRLKPALNKPYVYHFAEQDTRSYKKPDGSQAMPDKAYMTSWTATDTFDSSGSAGMHVLEKYSDLNTSEPPAVWSGFEGSQVGRTVDERGNVLKFSTNSNNALVKGAMGEFGATVYPSEPVHVGSVWDVKENTQMMPGHPDGDMVHHETITAIDASTVTITSTMDWHLTTKTKTGQTLPAHMQDQVTSVVGRTDGMVIDSRVRSVLDATVNGIALESVRTSTTELAK